MFHRWLKVFYKQDIRSRILTRGISLTVVPLTLVLIVIWITNGLANSVSVAGCSRLANQDLNHMVMSLVSACKLYDGYLSAAVDGARTLVDKSGAVHFDPSENLTWQATNQITAEITTVRLPMMRVGETAIRPVADFTRAAPIVDEVQALYQLSATVFQRMNDRGDMLRVSTNVKKADGSRAIGTYIPVMGANGKPNPVLTTVLKGQTYLGRAFVVNSWYIAAYQPLKDAKGLVIGMVYTGLPESQVRDKITQFKNLSDTEGSTNVFIIHTTGKEQGLFVFSGDLSLMDHSAWNYRDAHGELYVQEICKRAVSNKGALSESSYWSLPTHDKPSEKMLVRFSYFPAWDWVIGVEEPERQFLATPTEIKHIFSVSNYVPLLLVLISTGIALSIWNKLTNQVTHQVASVIRSLDKSSQQVAKALQAISGNADSVGDSAEELSRTTTYQASSAEETSVTTSRIADAAKRNSQAAERMLTLARNAESTVVEAEKTMLDVTGAMQSIRSTNDEALSIIDTINEISFATNIVALNASVEASKAGEAGRTFVFIADEVRQLAAKVSAAVRETRNIINNSRGELQRGTEFVAKLGTALAPMNQNADQVRQLAVDVSATSFSQAESMQEVLQKVEEMQKSTEETAQSAVQSTKDASDLRSQVAALAASVKTVDQAVCRLSDEFLGASHSN